MKRLDTIATIFRRYKAEPNVDPVRDWLIVLATSGVLLVGIIVWNILAFGALARGEMQSSSPPDTPALSRESLDSIRALFESRAAEESKYVIGEYTFADPSE